LNAMSPIGITNGCRGGKALYVPCFDSSSPISPIKYIGTNPILNNGLPAGVTQYSGRWAGISSMTIGAGPASVPNGNLSTYSQWDTGNNIAVNPFSFYAFDVQSTTAAQFQLVESTIGPVETGYNLTIAAPKYPPMTPDKLSNVFIQTFVALFGANFANFPVPDKMSVGSSMVAFSIIAETSGDDTVILQNSSDISSISKTQKKKLAVLVNRYVSTRPVQIGAYEPLDGYSATLGLIFSFKTVQFLKTQPFKVVNPSDGDVSLSLSEFTLAGGNSPTSYLVNYAASIQKGEASSVAILAAVHDTILALFAEAPIGSPMTHKDALLQYVRCAKRLQTSTHMMPRDHDITSMNSWSDVQKTFKSIWSFANKYIVPVAEVALPILASFI